MTNYDRISAENRKFWANMTEEDKRLWKRFLLGCFAAALAVIQVHAWFNPYWCF